MKLKKRYYILGIVLALIFLVSCSESTIVSSESETINKDSLKVDGDLKIHYIDVGQGDCILVQTKQNTLLIDAGENNQGKKVITYLEKLGIQKLDYVIGTHPHSDHIGGLDEVINRFEIGNVIMPKVVHTTKTYEDVLKAIQKKGLKIKSPRVGDQYKLGEATIDILGPKQSKYEDINDYSVVCKVTFGKNKFLFTGDAEALAEKEMLAQNLDLSADVLKVGHHGSRTSSSEGFLKKVNPKYAVIQLGKENDYGHPHRETLEKFKARHMVVYRTDLMGNIILTSDGSQINILNDKPVDIQTIADEAYIGNRNSKTYHLPSCKTLPKKENQISLTTKDIEAGNYKPCSRCIVK